MTAPQISIIIPVYNAAAYIEQCIRSVLNQTLQDIEIIAVNDGSTDNTKHILDQLATEDQRLYVFHNSNKGVSVARNFGLQQAKGTYIGFTDADDWMEPTMLSELYHSVQQNQCDWAICNVRIISPDGLSKTRLMLKEGVTDTGSEKTKEVEKFMQFIYDYANWNKLYSTAIIKEHRIRFDESMCLWEDLLFNLAYLQFSHKLTVVNKDLYNYRIQSASLTNTRSKELIPQFNLFYSRYKDFVKLKAEPEQWPAFRLQMGKGCYNHLLHQQAVEAKQSSGNYFQFLVGYYNRIKTIDPQIFYFEKDDLGGYQGFKKRLLMKQNFFLFSFFVVCTFLAKGIYKTFRAKQAVVLF